MKIIKFFGIILCLMIMVGSASALTYIDVGVNLLHNGNNIDTSKKVTIYYFEDDGSQPAQPVSAVVDTANDLGAGKNIAYWGIYDSKSMIYFSIGIYNPSDITIEVDGYENYTIEGVSSSINPALPITTNININSRPSVSNVVISPSTAYTNTDLSGSGTYDDADGDAENGSAYVWYKNGNMLSSETTKTLISSNFVKGDSIIFEYTPSDGGSDGEPVNSSPKVISNSLPTITSASLAPVLPSKSDTLTCTPSGWSDADGDAAQYNYEWYKNSVKINGESSSTLGNSNFAKGDQIYCKIIPNDGESDGVPKQSSTVTVQNTAPEIDAISDIIVEELEEVIIQATADDVDNDALTFTINDSRFTDEGNGRFTWTPGKFDSGVDDVKIIVFDGSLTDETVVTVTVNDRNVSKDISLKQGWNLFSIPVQPDSNDIDDVLSSIAGKYQIVWATNDNGVPQSTQNPFNPLDQIVPGKGYQIYMDMDSTLTVQGTDIESTTITVPAGWSLIGYPSMDTSDLSTVLAGKDYTIVWTTNNGVPQSTQNPFNPLSQFISGNGYRIYANTAFSFDVINS